MADKFVPLKQAASMLSRSVARTRQYVRDGAFGKSGEGWTRDEMGHIQVSLAAVKSYSPPASGNARASGVKSSTTLRHVRQTSRWIEKHVKESDNRRITLGMLNSIVSKLEDMAKAEASAVEDAAPAPAEDEPEEIEITDVDEDEEEDEDVEEMVLDL